MTTISNLLSDDTKLVKTLPLLGLNPFADVDILQESQILDVRVQAVTGIVGLIFELRQSLHFDTVDTGVLICRNVTKFAWEAPKRSSSYTAWSVESSIPNSQEGKLELSFEFSPTPGAMLKVVCDGATFSVGCVAGLEAAPPDYDQVTPGSEIAGVSSWSSEIMLAASVTI